MSSQNRYQVAPTVTMMAVMKARLTGAIKGHALLKKKADALTLRFRCDFGRLLNVLRGVLGACAQGL